MQFFKSDAYMHVRDIPYFLLLTSNFLPLASMFILECVCVRTRVYGRCVHAYELFVCPCIYPADYSFVFMFKMFQSACRPDV